MQIKVKNISHVFSKGLSNEFKAVDNVSTSITNGEFITIIGQSGSGKTTFIEHLNALLKPSEGSIEFVSLPLAKSLKANKKKIKKNKKVSPVAFEIKPGKRKIKEIKKLRKQVGIVFQFAEYQLFEETIEKDIIFGPVSMGMDKAKAKKQAEKYIQLVGLPKNYLKRSPFALSGGQKRRVALAGILSMEPDILIFDEPTAGLDPQGEIDMYKIFNKLHKQGKTIIIVTHNMDHVLENSQRTIVFNDGKIVYDGDTLKLMYDKKFLEKHKLEVPKLVDLIHDLRKKGKEVGDVRTISEFAKQV